MNLKPNFFNKNSETTKIHFEDQGAENSISACLSSLLPKDAYKPIVIICIGTDRSTGDSLGPLVGTKLQEKDCSLIHVYGTLEEPIHAVNLQDKLLEIRKLHPNAFTIGIDACLGRLKNVGMVSIGNGPIKPGAGVNKELPSVGDIHITGIVNVSGFMEFFVLQNTRLNLVMKMATTIANSIHKAFILRENKQILTNFKIKGSDSLH